MLIYDSYTEDYYEVIPVKKIEEKIEELKEDEEFYREQNRIYEYYGRINILQQLIKENTEGDEE